MLADHGISEFNGAQGRILFVLWEQDGITISELSSKTGLAKTTLTGMLDRLEEMGHIQRTSSPNDRRALKIILTPQAKGLKSKYDAVSAEMNEIFYRRFRDDEILAFEAYLGKILENLLEKEN
ncbi:MAG: MarR family transcriptional regulator [Ruminococcus sp.]|nr:MarR family transcriptional regulator [Ruminococcus sp.]MCM1381631.1 MarR family transcriptional regulator [Muribaculaceae bacterium]